MLELCNQVRGAGFGFSLSRAPQSGCGQRWRGRNTFQPPVKKENKQKSSDKQNKLCWYHMLGYSVNSDVDGELKAPQARKPSSTFPDFTCRIKEDAAVLFDWG